MSILQKHVQLSSPDTVSKRFYINLETCHIYQETCETIHPLAPYFCFPPEIDNVFTAGDAIGDIAFTPRKDDIFLTENQNQYIAKYEKASECINPRDLYMDRPARTLTCRNLGGATADMHRIKLPDGRRKRINILESARLQSFPDWFDFTGSKNSIFNQIGNAVPPMMSYHFAMSVLAHMQGNIPQNLLPKQMKMFETDV